MRSDSDACLICVRPSPHFFFSNFIQATVYALGVCDTTEKDKKTGQACDGVRGGGGGGFIRGGPSSGGPSSGALLCFRGPSWGRGGPYALGVCYMMEKGKKTGQACNGVRAIRNCNSQSIYTCTK